MLYKKPELVSLATALHTIRNAEKECPHITDGVDLKEQTPVAYQADE